ncbi:MAG TPA: penicillin acylase family protein [Nevskiaceae bacterium]|nr:penicillin acylase family protein [Nevskiaceae bacterium]
MKQYRQQGLQALVVSGLLMLGGCGSSSAPVTGTPPPDAAGASTFLNAMPPGSNGNSAGGVGVPQMVPEQPPPNFDDALQLYGNLAYARSPLQAQTCTPPRSLDEHTPESDQLCNYYKNSGLTPDVVVSEQTLTAPNGGSVTIQRDGWGTPFVDGANREAAMYGVGYASAEDRLWLHDLLRNIGRGRFSEYLGPANDTYDFDANLAVVAGYSEEEITQQVEATRAKFGALGEQAIRDIDAMVAGINDYIAFLQTPAGAEKVPPEYSSLAAQVPPAGLPRFPPAPWNRNDIVASAILIQSIFANGGGGEHVAMQLLQRLDPGFGPASGAVPQAACEFWRDVRHADDPQTPRTIVENFATQAPNRVDETCPQPLPAGAAILDPGSLENRVVFQATPVVPLPAAATRRSVAGLRLPSFESYGAPPKPAFAVQPPQRPQPRQVRAQPDAVEGARQALAAAGFPLPRTMSNFVGVTADQSQSGHPIVVMGPQASYFLPQLLWEVAVVSRGGTALDFAGRGVVFGDLPYINIGRGLDYAWSATSGGSDLTDIRVSRLCNLDGGPASREDADGDGFPDADGYLFDAGDGQGPQCRALYRRVDEWTANTTVASLGLGCAGGPGPACREVAETVNRFILRTHYGPVFATGTVGGEPVVLSRQRATFFGELDTIAPFMVASTPTIEDAQSFIEVFNGVSGTFNWLYADHRDIAFIHSGLYPLRHPQAHPELPVWGDGRFEWAADENLPADFFSRFGGDTPYPGRVGIAFEGDPLRARVEFVNYLPRSRHPQVINPPLGHIHSWNNNPAAGWWAADFNGTFGPTHRADILLARLEAFQASGRKHDVATLAEIAADAAFVDLRGQTLLPPLLRLLESGSLSAEQRGALDLLERWLADGSRAWIDGGEGLGAYRRDRDRDGVYDHRAAVVLMDAWYPELILELLPQLVAQDGFVGNSRASDPPRAQGSAYQEGWFQHLKRVVEMVNGESPAPYRALRCADGSAEGCRSAALQALDAALVRLGGLANQAGWDGSQLPNAKNRAGAVVEDYDAVEHTPISFYQVAPIHWTNRPTFQQVVEVREPRP